MFKKIRNRILFLNMIMASAVVIAAFAVIFITAYTREQRVNNLKLSSDAIAMLTVASWPIGMEANVTVSPEFAVESGFAVGKGFARRILPDAGLSFSLLVDNAGNLVEINSVVDLPDDLYEKAALEAASNKNHNYMVSLGGRTWQYAVSPIPIEFRESNAASLIVSGAYKDIRFLDVTDSQRMLWSLGVTLSSLTVVILAAFFLISLIFANRAIKPMEDAFDRQSRFVADASHELKTPLSIINANCSVLNANKEETVESQGRWVDSIMRASDRMTTLVGNLLSLADMQHKERAKAASALDLSCLVSDSVNDMEQPALEKGLAIRRRIEPDVEIMSDADSVMRILEALLDNAIKYTAIGGAITVTLSKEKHRAVFAVRNSGEGVPKDELPLLFDRFYRGDPARSSGGGGSGLGLSIAATVAERLGAKLAASSEPGLYTEFRLEFDSRHPNLL